MAQISAYRRPVLDPYSELIIDGLDLPSGIKNSFLAKLRNSRARRSAGNLAAARTTLRALANEIHANPGRRLSEEQVETLVLYFEAAIAGM